MAHVLVLGDSLTFHGPDRPHPPSDPRLYPNVAASVLGPDVRADVVARLGWTARDAWWALTRDPNVWGELLPRADGLVLGVGGMDHLPAAVPTWLRDSMPYVRPGSVRRRVREVYRSASPYVIRATGGRLRQLPQAATDHYLSRILQGVHTYRPGLPAVLLGPSPYDAAAYPSQRHHDAAVAAARRWATRHGVGFVDLDPLVGPAVADGTGNPDGMHWGWDTHASVGSALAEALRSAGWDPAG